MDDGGLVEEGGEDAQLYKHQVSASGRKEVPPACLPWAIPHCIILISA